MHTYWVFRNSLITTLKNNINFLVKRRSVNICISMVIYNNPSFSICLYVFFTKQNYYLKINDNMVIKIGKNIQCNIPIQQNTTNTTILILINTFEIILVKINRNTNMQRTIYNNSILYLGFLNITRDHPQALGHPYIKCVPTLPRLGLRPHTPSPFKHHRSFKGGWLKVNHKAFRGVP